MINRRSQKYHIVYSPSFEILTTITEYYSKFEYLSLLSNKPMKGLFLCFISMFAIIACNAQGTFAGSMKKLIGVKYIDSNAIPELKNYTYHEASLMSSIDDPETLTVDLVQKGSDAVVFFSIKEDQNAEEYTIVDVLEYKNIPDGWQIKAAMCRQNEIANVEIVALVKSGKEEFLKPVKQAWRFNRDKRRLQAMDKQGIDCISEGGD